MNLDYLSLHSVQGHSGFVVQFRTPGKMSCSLLRVSVSPGLFSAGQ